jgi:hypothetical protein
VAKPPPAVIGILTEPAPPTWWKAHRHQVLLIVGVFVGWQIAGATHGAPDHGQHGPTRPAHSSTPSASSTTSPKEKHGE